MAFVEYCAVLCDETIINAENRVEYVQVTGALTFDGAPVVYDEVIRLSFTTGTYRDGRQPPPMWGPVLNRDRIVKRVGRGILSLNVLIPKDKATYVWDGSAASLKTVGTRADVPLLQFSWIADSDLPRSLESYDTASYFDRPNARIKVTEPLRFSRIAPGSEIAARSEAQAKIQSSRRWSGPAFSAR